jgi:hypothetical protein
MRPYFEFGTTPKANKVNHPLEAGMLPKGEKALQKNRDYILCIPVSVYEAKMTQVNADDADEDITFILRRTGEEVYFTATST